MNYVQLVRVAIAWFGGRITRAEVCWNTDSTNTRLVESILWAGLMKELRMQALHDFWMYVPPAMQYVVIALVIFAIAATIGVYKLLTKK